MTINSLPKEKNLDWAELKAFADNKMNAFSPFPTMFSKAHCFRVIKIWDCVLKC